MPANGDIISCSSGRVGVGYEGDTCNFTCNTGYELTGSDTRTCQSNGSWSGTDDVCRRGSCHALYYAYCRSHVISTVYVMCRQQSIIQSKGLATSNNNDN